MILLRIIDVVDAAIRATITLLPPDIAAAIFFRRCLSPPPLLSPRCPLITLMPPLFSHTRYRLRLFDITRFRHFRYRHDAAFSFAF